ncbi:MAG: TIGR03118 family protein, partial [Terriglobus sp.]
MIRDEQPHRTLNLPRLLCRLSLLTALVAVSAAAEAQTGYVQSNLISDGSVSAVHTDPNLINPWGLSIGKDFWINSPGSGLSLVTDAKGNPSFNVSVPPAQTSAPHGTPAGTVFNPDTTAFIIPSAGSATFLFSTLDGTIAAWNASTPSAVTVANNSATKASYTDIAIDKSGNNTFLLAANFSGGTVDVFDTNFKTAKLAGSFVDPQLPSGYSPFGIHTIGTKVYVTYAQLNTSNGREVLGAGLGYVDVFDLNGNFLQRAIGQGVLNAPWGMALAPSTFGQFANDLLVGNFGDGTINAYDASSFAFQGTLQDGKGAPITNTGLWEIVFGVGSGSTVASAGDPNTLYIAA